MKDAMTTAAPAGAAATGRTAALAAVRATPQDCVLLLDFDHTLLAGNSTEDFLALARPRLVIAGVLALFDALKPWRLLPARRNRLRKWRDVLRIRLATLLDPGLWRRWRTKGAPRAAARLDRDLLAIVSSRDVVVTSLGFDEIIRPILANTQLVDGLVAMPLPGGPAARDGGKLERCRAVLAQSRLAQAIVVTDDPEADRELIEAAGGVINWPPAGDTAPALTDAYLPMRYATMVKRPGLGLIRRIYLGEDAATLVIATAFAAGGSLATAVAAICAALSFACIYDIGYAENDRIGRLREAAPVTPPGWDRWRPWEIAVGSWLGAAVFATPAVALLASGWAETGLLATSWAGLLVVQRAVFALFNRTPVRLRILPFTALQTLKSFGTAAALGLAMTPAGAALLTAVVAARVAPYALYRFRGVRWVTPDNTIRFGLYAVLTAAAVSSLGPVALDVSAAAGLLWCLAKARREIANMLAPAAP